MLPQNYCNLFSRMLTNFVCQVKMFTSTYTMHHNRKHNKKSPERKQIQLAKISHGFEYYDKTFIIYNNNLQNKKNVTN